MTKPLKPGTLIRLKKRWGENSFKTSPTFDGGLYGPFVKLNLGTTALILEHKQDANVNQYLLLYFEHQVVDCWGASWIQGELAHWEVVKKA